jgi:hypothetical protein
MKTQAIEKYIEMRNTNKYDIVWFYEHYMEASQDRNMDFNKFQAIFQMANLDSILNHLDEKFKVDRLYTKEGNFISCYPTSN